MKIFTPLTKEQWGHQWGRQWENDISGGKINYFLKKLRTSGGTISDHIHVIRNSYESIVPDVIEPRGGKKAKIAKEYELGLYIGRRSIKP